MKGKKPGSRPNPWKARQQAIQSADDLMAKAKILGSNEVGDPKQACAALMQAALFYEAAARAYRRGSLGLLARHAWAFAKVFYLRLDHEAAATRCEQQRAAVQPRWGDDESPPIGTS